MQLPPSAPFPPGEGRLVTPVANGRISTSYEPAGPLTIADIADRGITLAVRNWRTLSVLILLEAVPVSIMRVAVPTRGPVYWTSFAVDIMLVALLYSAGILTAVSRTPPPPGPVLKAAARRYGAALGTTLISVAWMMLWTFVAALAGAFAMLLVAVFQSPTAVVVAGAVLGGGTALVLLPRAGLVAATMLPIVILERSSPWDALTRAQRRVNHDTFLRSSLLGLALFAVTVAPVLVVGAAVDAIVDATHLEALRALAELLSDAVSIGLGTVLSTVAALDLRARYEGTDVAAELDAAAT
jgi:hypothetical protein